MYASKEYMGAANHPIQVMRIRPAGRSLTSWTLPWLLS
jgi:hypothetical protein